MFYSSNNSYAGAAGRRYAAIATGSRVEGATPHQLVKILFDELLLALDAGALAVANSDRAKALDKQTRALSILHALESSLDFDKGGEVATGLAQIYRQTRRLTLDGLQKSKAEPLKEARTIIAEISDAWSQIGR